MSNARGHGRKERRKTESKHEEAPAQGNEDCPCIGINELEGETVATLKNGKKVMDALGGGRENSGQWMMPVRLTAHCHP